MEAFQGAVQNSVSWRIRLRWLRWKAGHIVAHPRDHARAISNSLTIAGLPLMFLLVFSPGHHWFFWDNPHARFSIILTLVVIGGAWFSLRVKLTDPPDKLIETFPSSRYGDTQRTDTPEDRIIENEQNRKLLDVLIAEASTFSVHYGTAVLALLADILAEPKTYVHRSSECVEVGRRVTKRSVQLYMFVARHHLPSEAEQKILIPLAQQEKGRMYERMSIRSQTDDNVVALSYGGGSMAAYVAVLMHLYSTVFDLKETYKDWDHDRQREFVQIVGWIATSAAGLTNAGSRFAKAGSRFALEPGHPDAAAVKRLYKAIATAQYVEKIEHILNGSQLGKHSEVHRSQRSKLARIAKIGITHYVIIVQCLPAEYMNFTYAYSQPTAHLFCNPRNDEGTAFTRRFQKLSKIPNGFLRLSMAGARHSKSYHMDISVQETGSYIQQAHFQIEKEGDAELTERQRKPVLVNPYHPISVNSPYLRPPVNSNTSAHVYGRHLGRLFRDGSGHTITEIEDIPTGES